MELDEDGGLEAKEKEEELRRRQVARGRWGILRNALLNRARRNEGGDGEPGGATSKRTFPGFDLFTKVVVREEELNHVEPSTESEDESKKDFTFVRYTARFPNKTAEDDKEGADLPCSVVVRHPNERVALGKADLAGFDNTGNICVWPSEEVLAYYCLQNPEQLRNKRVCEVGAGLGLAGLVAATHLSCASVLITDGNDKATQNLACSVKHNAVRSESRGFVRGEKLLWDRRCPIADRYRSYFDLVVAADCLFLHEYHDDLLHILRELLRPGGEALIIAPRRGRTLAAFVERAKQDTVVEWRVQVDEEYDRLVWSRHQELLSHGISGGGSAESDQTATAATYQPDIHYPWLLRLIHP